jgi:hypothetical protein
MCHPSQADRGVALWMVSLAASRASRTPSPDSGSAKTTNVTFGRQRAGSSSKRARGSSSSRTSAASSRPADWNGSGEMFVALVTSLRLDFSLRQKLARATVASGASSSVWPTPAARDWKGTNGEAHMENGSGRLHLDQLPNFVEHLWYTPSVPNGGRALNDNTSPTGTQADGTKRQIGLENQVRRWHASAPASNDNDPLHWPTPTSLSFSESHQPGNSRSYNITMDLASSLRGRLTSQGGSEPLKLRRTLNPQFVEWLMGWPHGWTCLALTPLELRDSDYSAMALSRWKQRMRSALFQLASPADPVVQNSLFG